MHRLRMPVICGRSSRELPQSSEAIQSGEDPTMKRSLLITALIALTSFVTSSVIAQEDTPAFGTVTAKRKTTLKAAPSAQAAAATMVDANTELRWMMGDRKG